MSELLSTPAERARKAYARILQAMQDPGSGVAIAGALGASASTVSRIKNERLEECLAFLYAAGFKIVSQGKTCVDADEISFLRRTYARVTENEQRTSALFNGDDE